MWFLYNVLFVVGYTLLLPKFLLRMRRRGGYRQDFGERFGVYARGKIGAAQRGRIWVHAVSVGEAQLALRLMEELRSLNPEAAFIISTTTSTGHTFLAERKHAADVLVYYPADLPWIVNRVIRQLDPVGVVLLECELWPNALRALHRRQVPVWVVNGRLSQRSYAGYRKVRLYFRRVAAFVCEFLVQTESDAGRLRDLGAPAERVHVMGSAKFDLQPPSEAACRQAHRILEEAGLAREGPLWVMGSTWPGEEALLLQVLQELRRTHPALRAILVPRHMERRAEIEALLRGSGLPYVKRSAMPLREAPPEAPVVLLADTTGELPGYYSLATFVYVGKSLAGNEGGQNPVEPAMLGKAVITGPHMENFPSVMEDLESAGGVLVVADGPALRSTCERLLSEPGFCSALGDRAAALVASRRGVLARSAARIHAGLQRVQH